MNNLTYDIELFNKNCGNITSSKYQEMNKTQLIASISSPISSQVAIMIATNTFVRITTESIIRSSSLWDSCKN